MVKKFVLALGLRDLSFKDYFGDVKMAAFSFFEKLAPEDLAFLQYRLLLNKGIIQAHFEFSSGTGFIIGLPNENFSKKLRELGIRPKFILFKWMPYKEMIRKNNL